MPLAVFQCMHKCEVAKLAARTSHATDHAPRFHLNPKMCLQLTQNDPSDGSDSTRAVRLCISRYLVCKYVPTHVCESDPTCITAFCPPLMCNQGHSRPGSVTDQAVRTRYLRAMASNAGAVPWNNGADDGEEGGDEESVGGETASIDLPELSEGREVNNPKVPHLLSDLSDRTFSPRSRHLDLGRSQSLSSVGMGSINNVRVSQKCASRSSEVEPGCEECFPPQT